MKPKEETMWAVWNDRFGFYVGTAFTRKEMKEQHMSALGYLDWSECAKKGDKCIKVKVTPL
jgi:hypothetical protein